MSLLSLRRRSTASPLALAAAAAVAALFAVPVTPAFAQVPDARPQEEVTGRVDAPLPNTTEAGEDDVGSALGATIGVTFSNAYYFRGYLQEDEGLIVQPYAELGIALVEGEEYGLNVALGTWNSFHSEKTFADDTPHLVGGVPINGGPDAWYESDLYGGITFAADRFELGFLYTYYAYPNGAFGSIEEVAATLGYGLLFGDEEGFALAVDLGGIVAFETDDANGSEDAYAEVSVTPGFDVYLGEQAIALGFPVAVGFSLDNYYVDEDGDDEPFGFVSVGVTGSVPIPVPPRYGEWALTLGGQYLFLNAANLEANNDGDDSEIIGSVNVEIGF